MPYTDYLDSKGKDPKDVVAPLIRARSVVQVPQAHHPESWILFQKYMLGMVLYI